MLCDECKERPATVHVVKVVNGVKTEMKLCEQCAREKGAFQVFIEPPFSLPKLISAMLQMDQGQTDVPGRDAADQCPACGIEYSEFKRTGFLGCPECYTYFGPRLRPLYRRIHGATRHTGKVPARAGGPLKARRELASLEAELREAIAAEAYEKAAELRDRIRQLKRQLGDQAM